MLRMRLAAVLILSTGALAACGGGSDSSSSDSSDSSSSSSTTKVQPSTGAKVTADDFTFNAPDDWTQNDGSSLPSVNFLALAVDPNDKDGFSDNVNVIADPTITKVDNVGDLGKSLEKVLNGVAKDVQLGKPITVDGEDAATASATFTQGTVTYKTVQYGVAHDDKGYIITFSFSEDRPRAEQLKIATSVMASWAWAS